MGRVRTAMGDIDSLLADKDAVVRRIFDELAALRHVAPVPETKKTSVHLLSGGDGSAFGGVHPRKSSVCSTFAAAIRGQRKTL